MSIYNGRTPCGVRGLKCTVPTTAPSGKNRRTPCGVRGLKCELKQKEGECLSRTPCGVRGLKVPSTEINGEKELVAPRVGCVD